MRRSTGVAYIILGAVFAAGLLVQSVQAEIFRWVDKNGVVNYTQQRPHGVDSVQIGETSGRRGAIQKAGTTSATPAAGATQAGLTPEQQAKLDELKAAQAASEIQLAADRQENCRRAESMLSQLTARSRIRLREEDGTERALGEDERQARISDAQMRIAENCV